jgi:hypothetical protein
MSPSDARPQSPAERRAAEAAFRTLVAKHARDHRELFDAARRSLRRRLPAANEIVYEYRSWFVASYSPSDRGYEGVLALRADKSGVRLYFNRGKDLSDPSNLLRGSGGLVRFIPLDHARTLARPAVAALIRQAVALSKSPFPSLGRGALILRPAAPARRARRPKE